MIKVENLKKEFTYYKKMTGIKGSLQNMFHRESLTKEAVRDISFSVEKGEKKGRTFTNVMRLDREGRVDELARLIGGSAVTDSLRASASELLEQAEAYRQQK